MNTKQLTRTRSAAFVAAAIAVMTLAACGKNDDSSTVGQKVDGAIATTEQKADEAKVAATEMAKDAKTAVVTAGEKVADKVSDAAITTGVNAELAKDSSLSAMKINVDTTDGRVALKGTAPNPAARERATSLALAVKGVVSVDNQLSVQAGTM